MLLLSKEIVKAFCIHIKKEVNIMIVKWEGVVSPNDKNNIKNISCNNKECSYNKEGYCTTLTYNHLLNKISCEERKW